MSSDKIREQYDIAKQLIKEDTSLSSMDKQARLFNVWIQYINKCALKSDPIKYKELNNEIQTNNE